MTLAQLIPLALQISMGLIVLSIALRADDRDLAFLLRRPGLLLRSLLAMMVVMPLIATVIASQFDLRNEVKVALLLLAVSPVPPMLPASVNKAGGNMSYGIGLLAISSLLAIVMTPVSVAVIGRYFGKTVQAPTADIATAVAISVLAPLLIGATIRRVWPATARFANVIARAGAIVVMLAFAAVIFVSWRAILGTIGDFTLVAILLFIVASLAVGHVLGGPDHEDRTVLALATASRHPGVALAVASAVAADKSAVAAAVLLAFLVGMGTTGAYAKLRKRALTSR